MTSAPPESNQNPETPVANAPHQPAKQKNTVGLIALIVGIVGFIFACIPGALILGWVLLPVALILGIVGVARSGKPKVTSIIAIILSVVGTIVGFIVFFVVVAGAVSDAVNETTGSGDTTVTVPTEGEQEAEGEQEEEAPAEPEAAEQGTRANPYPVGSIISDGDWEVVVNSVTLDATDAIVEANMFNEEPTAGSQYLMVDVTATYNGNDPDGKYPLVGLDYVTSDGNTIDGLEKLIVPPEQFEMSKTLYEGASTTGNFAFEVPSATAGEGTLAVRASMLGDKVFVAIQ